MKAMNQISRRLALVVSLACVAATTTSGETLEDAWRDALQADRTLAAARDRIESANADLAGMRATRLPTVSTSVGITRWNEVPAFDFAVVGLPTQLPLFGGRSMQLSEARVSLPIYTGGETGSGIAAASAGVAARESAAEAATQTVKLAVAERYIDVLRAQSALEASDAAVVSLAAHVADVEDRFATGDVARNDALAAAVALADAEQRQFHARSALDLARSAYNRQLGRPFAAPVDLDERLPGLDGTIDGAMPEAIVALALERRSELLATQAQVDALLARSDAAAAAVRPKLFATSSYTFVENEVLNREDFWTVGLGFTWNVFDGGRARRTASALASEARATSREKSDLESWIALEVRGAWLGAGEARERVRVAERAVEQAEENMRVVSDRYRNGESTNTEVLDAERLRSQSISNRDGARYDAALADLRLARAAGLL
jgi:outer membrane protein